MFVRASLYKHREENQLDVTEWFIALVICDTFMPIIRSLTLYLCYYRIWCVMPWLLVVGGQVQGSRHSLWLCLLLMMGIKVSETC